MEFNDIIKTLRIKNGLDRKEAAQKLNIGFQTLGHYETGRSEPPFKVLKDMAKLYGVTIGELFGEASPAPVSNEEKKNLLVDIVQILNKNGALEDTSKFEDLDPANQDIIKSVLNKIISDVKK